MDAPDIWALFDLNPLPTFYKGRVALLGDAAHATTPHQGAGAGQALEDAYVLSALLGDERTHTVADLPAAFMAYDAVRRPRSQKVVSTSRSAGLTYAFRGPAGDNREAIAAELSQRYRWIWEEDMVLQSARAKELLPPKGRGLLRFRIGCALRWTSSWVVGVLVNVASRARALWWSMRHHRKEQE